MQIEFPKSWNALDVVLSHDWLTGMRGGERVLELLGKGFPDAPIYSLIHNRAAISESINQHTITTSWLQNVPGILKYYRYGLRFFPSAIERFETPPADLLISTSHCVAKGIKPQPGTKHVCYCFTPMRYAWTFYEEYFGTNPLKKAVLKPMLAKMRDWDKRASDRVDRFVAISKHVQGRIRSAYDREADVVYPPTDTDALTPGEPGNDGFDLIVSALVPYKKVDLAVDAYTRLGYPLKIVGVGTEMDRLKKNAGPNVEFAGWQSDETVLDLYRRCRCLIFPGEEDFGLVPIEAQSCGKPVVAYGKGGTLETIVDGETGVFFPQQTPGSLLEAVETCAGKSWDPQIIRKNAQHFGIQQFLTGLESSIANTIRKT